MKALEVYLGSDGAVTSAYYAELTERGPIGELAVALFRAQKCSARAKVYRGGIRGKGRFKDMAYERKQWSMERVVTTLEIVSEEYNIGYGWKPDPEVVFGDESSFVLYVDLPQGQVSFHSPTRGKGPDYTGAWDGRRESEARIIQFCDSVFQGVLT